MEYVKHLRMHILFPGEQLNNLQMSDTYQCPQNITGSNCFTLVIQNVEIVTHRGLMSHWPEILNSFAEYQLQHSLI